MRRATVLTSRPAHPLLSRRVLALAAILAFFLQSLAVQTHIHPAGPHLLVPSAAAAGQPLPAGPLKSPDLDQGSCRLCQEMAHAGAYLTPVISFLPVALAFAAEPLFLERTQNPRAAPAFGWRSRGPPRH
ncbi:MAG: hypothetical protein H6924_01390 [Alphaproteobacteria bacterium]|nr:hypothetical protein [Alphaproteobacteria bacterium]